MHAVEIAATGGPEVLELVDRPQPSPAAGEVVIRSEAIGVNYIDTYFRSGIYPAELPFVLGNEAAGVVAETGAGVTTLSGGDRVVTAAATGGYAQYCA
ncbi:alcohol dehydrogenase catalytic domain-containing protein, partial [Mycolicibacter algericus]